MPAKRLPGSAGVTIICDEVSRRAIIDEYVRNKSVKVTCKTLIQEKNLSHPPIDKHFTCCICLEPVHEPKKCQQCETTLCGSCSKAQKSKNDTCPTCRVTPFELQQLNKYE